MTVRLREGFLSSGVIWATLREDGTMPVRKEELMKLVSDRLGDGGSYYLQEGGWDRV